MTTFVFTFLIFSITFLKEDYVTNIYKLHQHTLYINVEYYDLEMPNLQERRALCVEWTDLTEF